MLISSINEVLSKRSDVWFLFQNTEKFIDHERVIHLPKSSDEIAKVKFINSGKTLVKGYGS